MHGCKCVCIPLCRFAEITVLICFVLLALLWLFRDPKVFKGWGAAFKTDNTSKRYSRLIHTKLKHLLLGHHNYLHVYNFAKVKLRQNIHVDPWQIGVQKWLP